jgi:hypothetical protein
VIIDEKVLDTLRTAGLTQATRHEILHRLLTLLPADPDGLLGERIVPFAYFAYSFALPEGAAPSGAYHFLFAVDRDDQTNTLHVMHCRITPPADIN